MVDEDRHLGNSAKTAMNAPRAAIHNLELGQTAS
jgi:hypothetical protein